MSYVYHLKAKGVVWRFGMHAEYQYQYLISCQPLNCIVCVYRPTVKPTWSHECISSSFEQKSKLQRNRVGSKNRLFRSFRGFPLLERIMNGIADHLPAKMHYIAEFCIYNLNFFRKWYPGSRRSVPSAWAQTPISAWFVSVFIVPILRNDHCLRSRGPPPIRWLYYYLHVNYACMIVNLL